MPKDKMSGSWGGALTNVKYQSFIIVSNYLFSEAY